MAQLQNRSRENAVK